MSNIISVSLILCIDGQCIVHVYLGNSQTVSYVLCSQIRTKECGRKIPHLGHEHRM